MEDPIAGEAIEAFGGEAEKPTEGPNIKDLHAKIGRPTLERNFLEGALSKAGIAERKEMIDPHPSLTSHTPGRVVGSGAFDGLLPSQTFARERFGADAPDRRVAPGTSVCGQPHDARSAACRRIQCRPAAHPTSHEEDGYRGRGAVSARQYESSQSGAQDLSLSSSGFVFGVC